MKSIVRAAFIAASLCFAAGAAAFFPANAADAPKTPNAPGTADTLSRDVEIPLAEAQKAMKENDLQTALEKVKEAQATTDRTPYDDFMINSFLVQIYLQKKDYASAIGPVYALADSPALPEEQKKNAYFNAFQLAMFSKQYPKAVEYGQKLQAVKGLDAKTEGLLAQAFYITNDFAHAEQMARMAVDAAKAAGQTPDEVALEIVMNSQMNQNDLVGVQGTLETLALNFNKPDSWSKLIDIALSGKNVKDADALYLLRLKMLIPGAMHVENGLDDYTSLASAADHQGYPVEAYDVLQKGISRGKISAKQAGETLAHSRAGATLDERTIATIAQAAERAKNGEQDIKLAEDYWGYGRFADAVTAARRAIGKDGLKDPSEGPMLLGMLLTVEGQYDEAIKALGDVNGSQTRKNVAHVWSLYAQAQKKAQSAAAQTATQH